MSKTNKFEVEYAKSNMATCRVCMAKIPKESLRIGHLQVELENDATAPSADGDDVKVDRRMLALAGATRWHHFECFPRMKGAKWMAANLPADPTSIGGFSALKKADQGKVRLLWKTLSATSDAKGSLKRKADGSEAEPSTGKRVKTKEATEARLSKLTSVQGVLKAAPFQKVQKLETALGTSTTAQLQAELLKNNQVRTGKKEDLVQRVAEGRVLGALPACPKCGKGQIHWSRIGGWYSCPGYFDREARIQKRCSFRAQELKRGKWKN